MARRVRNAVLENRSAREKLKPRGKPFYKAIGAGLHIGYRKGKAAGRWVARLYLGGQDYRVETMADADDRHDPNGTTIIDFWQAQERARALYSRFADPSETVKGPYTVKNAMDDYAQWLDTNQKSAADARYRASAFILPKLGSKEAATLTAKDIRSWQADLARAAPRLRIRRDEQQKFRGRGTGEKAWRRK
jgi:hypothetical protein